MADKDPLHYERLAVQGERDAAKRERVLLERSLTDARVEVEALRKQSLEYKKAYETEKAKTTTAVPQNTLAKRAKAETTSKNEDPKFDPHIEMNKEWTLEQMMDLCMQDTKKRACACLPSAIDVSKLREKYPELWFLVYCESAERTQVQAGRIIKKEE